MAKSMFKFPNLFPMQEITKYLNIASNLYLIRLWIIFYYYYTDFKNRKRQTLLTYTVGSFKLQFSFGFVTSCYVIMDISIAWNIDKLKIT